MTATDQISTIAAQVSTWVSECRCLAASDRTRASEPVAVASIRSVIRLPVQLTSRASRTAPRTISRAFRPGPRTQ